MNLEKTLFKYFGYNSYRKNQKEIIEAIINGNNVLTVLPTGAGKSLCYQIPSLISINFSIIVSPLIALMKDQVDSINKQEEIAAFINSTMEFYEIEEVLQKIAYGKIKLLYVAPERLENIGFAERIKKLNPSYLFIDEAHCISEWGHNFRPSYRKIKDFAQYVKIDKIAAFTATATPEVVDDIVKQLNLKDAKLFVKGFERENLFLNVLITKKKKEKCLNLISQFKTPAIIYTSSRKKAEEVAEFLNMNRINAAYYHAGLASQIRKKIQEDFINDKLPIIVATNAFGMGIDKKDIRLIIHFNTPGSIENYYQEIGRAGRDGKNSQIYLLHDDNDIKIQNYFLANSHPDKDLIQKIYNAVCDYGQIAEGVLPEKEIPINLEYISAHCKKEVTKGLLHSSLKILEEGGYIKQLSEYERKITLQINYDKDKLKSFVKRTINNELKEIILDLVREFGNKIFSSKISLPINQLSKILDIIENDLDKLLVTLDNLGIITYHKITAKENIILISPRINSDRLKLDYKKINENYLHLLKKIEQMVDYVFSNECRFKYILNYFGEDTTGYKCGRCDKCSTSEIMPETTINYIKEIILRTLVESKGIINETTLLRIISGSGRRDSYSQFSTYDSCSNYEKNDLQLVIHELIFQKLIKRKEENRKSLIITENGYAFLKENGLTESEPKENEDYEDTLQLYNLLREVRQKAAKKFMQTGYLICPDETLRAVALKKPKTKADLLSIPGFNNRMFNKLGSDFLEIINQLDEENDKNLNEKEKRALPQNISETYNLLKKGYNLEDISSLRHLSEAVISMQIETIIEYFPEVDISSLYDKNQYQLIFQEIVKGFSDMKELKQRLPVEITYPLIRIALAKFKFSHSSVKFQHT